MTDLLLYLLAIQALMGAFDTLYHHELTVALPRRPGAGQELAIHATRAVFYGVIFATLAWYEVHGIWAWVLGGIVLVEIGLTLWDFVIEDRTRLLPASERVTHTLLAINGGAICLVLALKIAAWVELDSAFVRVNYGWLSWFLSLAALGVTVSGIRDAFAAWGNHRLQVSLALDFGDHKRVLVSGGTGFIGSALCRELINTGHAVTVVSRQPLKASMQFQGGVRAIKSPHELSAGEQFDVVINLAGAPVIGPLWTKKRKAVLMGSRINTTQHLLDFVRRAKTRPRTWIQASAIGYYGTERNTEVDESSAPGAGFAAELCSRWEQESSSLDSLGVRRVVLRFGLIFGRSGGALPLMALPFRFALGSVLGDGKQPVNWMHIEDLLRLIALAVRDEKCSGVINAVTPEPSNYRDFAKQIGHQVHRPVFISVPAAPMRALMGEMATMLLDGPAVIPGRLGDMEFKYQFPCLRGALMDLL